MHTTAQLIDGAVLPARRTGPVTTGRPRTWLRFGVADVLMLVLAIGILQRSQGSMLDDPGLGWHIRNVDAMLAEGAWLSADPFSGPQGGRAWLANQWLGDLLLYFGWHWGGLEGIAVLTTCVLALTFRWLYQMLVTDGVAWPLAIAWTFLGALATSISWVARPNIFTLLFVMVTAWTLDRYYRGAGTRRQTLWLIPLMAVWANTHGGFVAGLLIIAAALLLECGLAALPRVAKVIAPARNREADHHSRVRHLALLLVGAVLATLLNPYSWHLYPWIFQLLGDPFFMNLHTEWLSPNFHEAGALRYECLILALPLLLAFSRRRAVSLLALLLSLLWLHFALGGARYIALWVVITVPLLARLSQDLCTRYLGGRGSALPLPGTFRREGFAGVLLIGLSLLVWARWTDGYSRHDPSRLPTAALAHVVGNFPGQVVFHNYGWGGWLTWHGWPQVKNWIDDRNEVQGQQHIEQYFQIMQARPGWEDLLRAGGVQVACLPVAAPLTAVLAERPDWVERYRDEYAAVYQRNEP